jgi:hypothetical protein
MSKVHLIGTIKSGAIRVSQILRNFGVEVSYSYDLEEAERKFDDGCYLAIVYNKSIKELPDRPVSVFFRTGCTTCKIVEAVRKQFKEIIRDEDH